MKVIINGVEVFPVNVRELPDKEPVYIQFDDEKVFKSQWGIVDKNRRATIHKDFVLSFNDGCRYYSLNEEFMSDTQNRGVIVKF